MSYTEVDGHAVLCDPDQRELHVVSPASARAWFALDGHRDLTQIADDADGFSVGVDHGRGLVEIMRRLRAATAIDEPAACDAARDDAEVDAEHPAQHRDQHSTQHDEVGGGPPRAHHDDHLPRSLDGAGPPATSIVVTGYAVERAGQHLIVLDPDGDPHVIINLAALAPAASPRVLVRGTDGIGGDRPFRDPLDALRSLVGSVVAPALSSAGTLDLLADVADAVDLAAVTTVDPATD